MPYHPPPRVPILISPPSLPSPPRISVREKLLCSIADTEELVSLSWKTIGRKIDEGTFPKPVNVGRDVKLFRVKDLIDWSEKLGT